MSKAIITKISTVALFVSIIGAVGVYAQTDQNPIVEPDSIFTWKYVEVLDPSSQSTVNFIPREDITPVSWDFGDSQTSTEASPSHTYSYSGWTDSVTITLSYTLDGASLSHSRKIPLSPAFFWILPDLKIGRLATYKRIFRSNFLLENTNTSIGNLHFSWTIDGVLLPGNEFIPAELGQWPNIYYTFQTGGVHTIRLEVYNTANPANVAVFTRTINIIPDFTAAKEILTNIPNVFTPNEDGVNDFFAVQTSGTANFILRIMSRSGALLYQNESNFITWDGRNSQGNDLPEGVYYYIIEDLSGLYETATGFVYIFRGK